MLSDMVKRRARFPSKVNRHHAHLVSKWRGPRPRKAVDDDASSSSSDEVPAAPPPCSHAQPNFPWAPSRAHPAPSRPNTTCGHGMCSSRKSTSRSTTHAPHCTARMMKVDRAASPRCRSTTSRTCRRSLCSGQSTSPPRAATGRLRSSPSPSHRSRPLPSPRRWPSRPMARC